MNKKKIKLMMEIKFLGCFYIKNVIMVIVVKIIILYESLKNIVEFWNWFEGLLIVMILFVDIKFRMV